MDFRAPAAADGARIAAQIERRGVRSCTASPPFIDRLAEQAARAEGRAIRLERILTGGAPVTDAQLEAWGRAFPDARVTVVYGSTEAEPVAHVEAAERLRLHGTAARPCPGFCVGRPCSRVRAKVIRIHDGPLDFEGGWTAWELPQGEVGELVVTGDHVCRDYFRNPEAVAGNKIDDGEAVWHRMGDTGYFDRDGRFWLAGRVHSTILRDGELVHPQLVEQLAAGTPARQAAALGIPDKRLGRRVVLVVSSPAPVNAATIRERARDAGLPVDEIRITTDPLPVDPRHNAKIDYGKLARELRGGRGGHAGIHIIAFHITLAIGVAGLYGIAF
jgi:acyl-CoA synthetase (AMP-forming)/AMP-acid ligase II